MSSISDFIASENAKMSKWDKFFQNYPDVYTTSSINDSIKVTKPETIVKPSILGKLVALLFTFLVLLFYIPIGGMVVNKTPIIFPALAFLFISFILYLLVWNSFFSRRYIYQIRLNNEYIKAQGKKIYWKDVSETFIMNKKEGRFNNSYLVIIKKDSAIEKLNLFKFGISDRKLASLVEAYKTKDEHTT